MTPTLLALALLSASAPPPRARPRPVPPVVPGVYRLTCEGGCSPWLVVLRRDGTYEATLSLSRWVGRWHYDAASHRLRITETRADCWGGTWSDWVMALDADWQVSDGAGRLERADLVR